MLNGKKILVVDDNEANQLLAKIILEKKGASVSLAENGQVAVNLFDHSGFDLILMDLQMPVMDGFEATRQIRRRNKQVPIIAFTANTLSKEEQRSRATGMNAFLAKPFKEKQLVHLVHLLLGLNEEEQKDVEENHVNNASNLFNLDSLIEISNGNKEFIDEMIDIFVDDLQVTANELRQALKDDDMDLVKNSAHKIKPSLETFCVPFYSEIREIEVLAENHDNGPKLAQLVSGFEKLAENVIPGLKIQHS